MELSGPGVDTHTMNAKHTASKSGYQIHVAFISTFPVSVVVEFFFFFRLSNPFFDRAMQYLTNRMRYFSEICLNRSVK